MTEAQKAPWTGIFAAGLVATTLGLIFYGLSLIHSDHIHFFNTILFITKILLLFLIPVSTGIVTIHFATYDRIHSRLFRVFCTWRFHILWI